MSFTQTLSKHERDLLRRVVKKVHMQHHPKDFQTNYEADRIIDVIGPEVIERMLKFAVDHKVGSL
jgi:hypothetical protein